MEIRDSIVVLSEEFDRITPAVRMVPDIETKLDVLNICHQPFNLGLGGNVRFGMCVEHGTHAYISRGVVHSASRFDQSMPIRIAQVRGDALSPRSFIRVELVAKYEVLATKALNERS